MENEQIADQVLSALQALLEAAGPEWTLEFLNAGLEEAAGGGGEMAPEQGMMAPGPSAPPPMAKRNALAQ